MHTSRKRLARAAFWTVAAVAVGAYLAVGSAERPVDAARWDALALSCYCDEPAPGCQAFCERVELMNPDDCDGLTPRECFEAVRP